MGDIYFKLSNLELSLLYNLITYEIRVKALGKEHLEVVNSLLKLG